MKNIQKYCEATDFVSRFGNFSSVTFLLFCFHLIIIFPNKQSTEKAFHLKISSLFCHEMTNAMMYVVYHHSSFTVNNQFHVDSLLYFAAFDFNAFSFERQVSRALLNSSWNRKCVWVVLCVLAPTWTTQTQTNSERFLLALDCISVNEKDEHYKQNRHLCITKCHREWSTQLNCTFWTHVKFQRFYSNETQIENAKTIN